MPWQRYADMEAIVDDDCANDQIQEASHTPTPLHLTFDAFEQGCQSWLEEQQQRIRTGSTPRLDLYSYGHGWQWVTHPQVSPHLGETMTAAMHSDTDDLAVQVPKLSHLSRDLTLNLTSQYKSKVCLAVSDDDAPSNNHLLDTIADPTEYAPSESKAALRRTVHMTQSIQYSSTWHVPVLWLQGWVSEDGTEAIRPLEVDDVLAYRSKGNTLQQLLESTTNDPQQQRGAYFPPITIADHPANGHPSVYLHPCQTAQVIGEMLPHRDEGDPNFGRRYLEAFLAICASAVEMRGN